MSPEVWEHYKALSRKSALKWTRKQSLVSKREKQRQFRLKNPDYHHNSRMKLPKHYIKQLLIRQYPGLTSSDIPDELVNMKIKLIKLKRDVKKIEQKCA